MEQPAPVEIVTERLVLTLPPPSAASRLLAYFVDNRKHLERWSPPRPPGFYTEEFWRWRLEQNRTEYVEDRSVRFSLLLREDPEGPVVGQASFTEFVRGPLQSCFLGYNVDHRHEGRGLMKEALEPAIAHVFSVLALHRISANYMPENSRSAALLAKLGFAIEGHAKDYLYIDGAWRDHVLTARLNPNQLVPGVR